eukprot:1161265-Pelagomonas_calceolata.AAC.7
MSRHMHASAVRVRASPGSELAGSSIEEGAKGEGRGASTTMATKSCRPCVQLQMRMCKIRALAVTVGVCGSTSFENGGTSTTMATTSCRPCVYG